MWVEVVVVVVVVVVVGVVVVVVVEVPPRLRQPLVDPAGRELDVAEGGGRGVEGDRIGPRHRCLEVVGVPGARVLLVLGCL